jgi:hypothetical protein
VEQTRQIEAKQKAADAAAPAGPTPEQLRASYDPVTEDMIKNGWLEQDMNDLYPVAVAGVVSMRDELFTRVAQLENTLAAMVNESQGQRAATVQQTVKGRIDGIFDELSSKGGVYAPLESKETRQNFLTHLEKTLNPEIDTLLSDPSVLGELWIGHNHQLLVEQTNAQHAAKLAELEALKVENAQRLAVGEGGGVAPSAGSTPSTKVYPGEEDTWGDL